MMITNIALTDGEPTEVNVTMSTAEAAAIAEWAGKLRPPTHITNQIWDCLTGQLFNRFYDDGLNDYIAGRGVSGGGA